MGLHRLAGVCFLFFLHVSVSLSLPQSILQYHSKTFGSLPADEFSIDLKNVLNLSHFCGNWRFNVEVNNAQNWTPGICFQFVKNYMTGPRYLSECSAVNYYALQFAKSVDVSGDGKDAWVFDVDETMLSNVEHFLGNGTESNIGKLSDVDWYSPAIPSTLKLFNILKKLRFKIFILTGRTVSDRAITIKNFQDVGYKHWERLILRGPEDIGTPATVFKSKKRKELEDEGYRIRGSSGDQWSDLNGYAVAERSFKLPNPLYYVA